MASRFNLAQYVKYFSKLLLLLERWVLQATEIPKSDRRGGSDIGDTADSAMPAELLPGR